MTYKRWTNLTLAISLILLSCNNSKKDSSKIDRETELISQAEDILSYDNEKIVLLSASKKINFDTLHLILRDYYVMTNDLDTESDSIRFFYNSSIESISNKYKTPKKRIASLIYDFKYEMITNEEIIRNNEDEGDRTDDNDITDMGSDQ